MKPVFAGMVFHADEEISLEISRQTPVCWQAIDARLKLSHPVQLDADFSELALFPDSAVAIRAKPN
jgi:hypothetical protein